MPNYTDNNPNNPNNPDDAYRKAQWRISDAIDKHQLTLNLAKLGLTSIPPEIERLTWLKQLYIQNNQLRIIPLEILRLSRLVELSFENNLLTVIPPEIRQLTKLQKLWLNGNQLTSIPPEINNLPALVQLKLNDNNLPMPNTVKNVNKSEPIPDSSYVLQPKKTSSSTDTKISDILDTLKETFNESEFKDLLIALDISWDELGGDSTHDKMRECVLRMNRRGKLKDLVTKMSRQNSNIPIRPLAHPALDTTQSMTSTIESGAIPLNNQVSQQIKGIQDAQDKKAKRSTQRTLIFVPIIISLILLGIYALAVSKFTFPVIEPWLTPVEVLIPFMLSYGYFAFSEGEFNPHNIYKKIFQAKQRKLYKENGLGTPIIG